MMANIPKNTVATAVRVEYNSDSDEVYLVFLIVDENFKSCIKKDWTQDIDLELINKNLVLDKKDKE